MENGIRVVIYLDDILLMCIEKLATDHIDFVTQTLNDLGLVVNWEKSDIVTTFSKIFIGFIVDSFGDGNCPWIKVPKKKVHKLKQKTIISKTVGKNRWFLCIYVTCYITRKLLRRNMY